MLVNLEVSNPRSAVKARVDGYYAYMAGESEGFDGD